MIRNHVIQRAQGCLVAMLSSDSSASCDPALVLARLLVQRGAYDPVVAARIYRAWREASGRDMSDTLLPRAAIIGISGVRHLFRNKLRTSVVSDWTRRDATLTHSDPAEVQAAALFAAVISELIETGVDPEGLHDFAVLHAKGTDPAISFAVRIASEIAPGLTRNDVPAVLQAVFHRFLHIPHFEWTVKDMGPSAAACGALLGASRGISAVPGHWVEDFYRPGDSRPLRIAEVLKLASNLAWNPKVKATVPDRRMQTRPLRDPNEIEAGLREHFNLLMAKTGKHVPETILESLRDIARVNKGIVTKHKYMFTDFGIRLRKEDLPEIGLMHAMRALSLAPDDAHACFNVAYICWILGRIGEARRHLALALQHDPNLEPAKHFLAWLDAGCPSAAEGPAPETPGSKP
ncbi:MAG: hypothetical protein FWH34_04755 [Desulfovibrionaceae bacterium]|nr:hypothetical protein [Desulfovibrionaceae bacterium]